MKTVLVAFAKIRFIIHKKLKLKRYKYDPGNPGVTLFDSITSMENLRLAHKNASKGKSWYEEVEMVNRNPDFYLSSIHQMLIDKTYENSLYDVFEKREGEKIRKVYKLPYFPDRIIQWAILQVIGPIIEKKFIKNTYSAISGRGPVQCMLTLSKDVRNDPDGTMFCLKIDIHHFYQSIDHIILKKKYLNLFKDENLLWLLFVIIDSVPDDEGIPIGNYTSQYSGNFYLSDFDHWIKEVCLVKYYYRYMDDMVFLASDKLYLHQLLDKIIDRFHNEERLVLKENYQIFPIISRGIDYVGYRIFFDYVLIRRRIERNFVILCEKIIRMDELTNHYRSALFSYIGFLQHANTYNLQKKYYEPIKIKFNLSNMIKTITI